MLRNARLLLVFRPRCSMPTKTILFVCVENSNRSQMAEAFARIHGGDGVRACSAGSKPSGRVNSRAIEFMQEVGYDLTSLRPNPLTNSKAKSSRWP